ncbi:hypothetical protein [Actinoplanes sp. CA-252034]|uniref:hypothetical protein n=1 Tax=Actinoplanes sp. CA-252034 TaxID=3239906 RepID=UPI003D97B740
MPMTWMNKAAGDFPVYLDSARGNRIVDVDGNEFVDFALGTPARWPGTPPPRSSPRSPTVFSVVWPP